MIKLYGIALSNYTNMIKAVLAEKGIDYEMVIVPPSQHPDYLAKSPMGRVPCLETAGGFLSETKPILDYLEDLKPSPALLPSEPYQRAKVRELAQTLELYVELVARKGIGQIFGKELPDHMKKTMARNLPLGIAAVRSLAKFSPWIAGDQFTYADVFAYYTFGLADMLAKPATGIDLYAEIPGATDWFKMVGERPAIKAVDAAMMEARAKMSA